MAEEDHYTFRINKWLAAVLGTVFGSALTFFVQSQIVDAGIRQQLEEHSKVLSQIQQQQVTRDVFDATIGPVQTDIADLKRELSDVRRNPEIAIRHYDVNGNPIKKPKVHTQ